MKTIKIFLALVSLGAIAYLGGNNYFSLEPSSSNVSEANETSLPDPSTKITEEFIEDCGATRCRCKTSRITQTVMTAGSQKADKKYDPLKRARRCHAPSGYNATLKGHTCKICPAGMTYSATLRDREAILQRMNLQKDVCVIIKRTCLTETNKRRRGQ